MEYAIVDKKNTVTNVILWDGMTSFDPGSGNSLLPVLAGEPVATGWTYVDGKFLPPPAPEIPLDELKARKNEELTLLCRQAIISGFTSSALGEPHLYPSDETDQLNLSASVLSSLMPGLSDGWVTPFLCCDSQSVWAYHQHTAAQIQQVGADGKEAIQSHLLRKMMLFGVVDEAKTADEMSNIVW